MNIFEIETTYKCNWNCEYCCVQTHTKRALSNEKILNNLKKSSNNYIDLNGGALTISGGEPSLTDPELIKEIYNLSKEHNFQLSLNTNGRIFYPKVYPIFKDIMKDIGVKRLTVRYRVRNEHWTEQMYKDAVVKAKQTIYGSQW